MPTTRFSSSSPPDTFNYEIHVPKDQPAGLHWYHPHRHSSSAKQGWSGLGGAIIVEGEIDKVPGVSAAHERLMLLQEIWLDNKGHVPMGLPIPTAGDVPFSTILAGAERHVLHDQRRASAGAQSASRVHRALAYRQ